MNKSSYGDIALETINNLRSKQINIDYDIVSDEYDKVFHKYKKSHKGCPRTVFLVLASQGFVKGINSFLLSLGIDKDSNNYKCVFMAMNYILYHDIGDISASKLWSKFPLESTDSRNKGRPPIHNGQMDVFLTLYKAQELEIKAKTDYEL